MKPVVVYVSGPPSSGKTTLARVLAARCRGRRPHYVRFEGHDLSAPALRMALLMEDMAGACRLVLSAERVFEQVADEVSRIAAHEPGALIVAESDGLPWMRHAYPYDVRVFILRPPDRLDEVFRSPQEVAQTIDRAMDDTEVFASEMYGLSPEPLEAVEALPPDPEGSRPKRTPVGRTVEEFLRSDVGVEITARLQLQPCYHALLDCDVALVNEGLGEDPAMTADCVKRIQALLERVRRLGRKNWFAVCDPLDAEDPLGRRSIEHIEGLIESAVRGMA